MNAALLKTNPRLSKLIDVITKKKALAVVKAQKAAITKPAEQETTTEPKSEPQPETKVETKVETQKAEPVKTEPKKKSKK